MFCMKSCVRFGLHLLKLFPFFIVCFLCGCVREATESAPVINGWNNAAAHSPVYVVKPGDTLYSVAWVFGLDYRNLAYTNHLSAPYRLIPGQTLNMVVEKASPVKSTSPVAEVISHPDLVVSPSPRVKPTAYKSMPTLTPKSKSEIVSYAPVHHWIFPARGRIVHGFSALPFGNKGIDIQGAYGETILASAPGRVVYAGAGIRGYGNLIILKHNDSYLSAYAYNKTINVKEGVWIKAGQVIGTMGRTDAGNVLLHFEIRRNGQPVNPMSYLSP